MPQTAKERNGRMKPNTAASHPNTPAAAPPTYIESNSLRKVVPYDYLYQTNAKGRWIGRELFEIFTKEFMDRTPEYYRAAILSGKIRINAQICALTQKIKNGDVISHQIHRHEPPVPGKLPTIVSSSFDMLVVNKPAGIPVHPTGRYHHNSLLSILGNSGAPNAPENPGESVIDTSRKLYLVNRLDRLTSGIVLIARTLEKSVAMMNEMKNRNIKKSYICRVRGNFPVEEILCKEPIKTVSYKLAVNIVDQEGKACVTRFKRMHYNGCTSVVECFPETGRTHQIRVHLQFLGFPIANDPVYCCAEIFGDELMSSGGLVKETENVLAKFEKSSFRYANDPAANSISEMECIECRNPRLDPLPEQLSLYLHAFRYEGEGWAYETSIPYWAEPAWNGDQDLRERFWKYGGKWDNQIPGELSI